MVKKHAEYFWGLETKKINCQQAGCVYEYFKYFYLSFVRVFPYLSIKLHSHIQANYNSYILTQHLIKTVLVVRDKNRGFPEKITVGRLFVLLYKLQ